jgi:hypothetical protein
MTLELISTAYFIETLPSVFVSLSLIVVRQWLGKIVTAATNTHVTKEGLLETSFYMQSMLYQRKVGDWFFPELLVACLNSLYSCRKSCGEENIATRRRHKNDNYMFLWRNHVRYVFTWLRML